MQKLFFQFITVYLSFALPTVALATATSEGVLNKFKKAERQPAQVRILLNMQPHAKVIIKSPSGKAIETHKPEKKYYQTLRARVNVVNHFYFSNWHVETVPVSWKRELRKLTMRLNFYRVRGSAGNLEERVGSTELAGVLVESEPGIYNLIARKHATFRNISGQTLLSLEAGFDPESDRSRLKVAKAQEKK